MKILQVNIFADYGSTGKLVQSIHNGLLNSGSESIICYGRKKRLNDFHYYKIAFNLFCKFYKFLSFFTGDPNAFAYLETKYLEYIIKKEKPDIVHLHCLNCFYSNTYELLRFLKRSKIKVILTLHAELMYTGSCAHAYECEKWLNGCGSCGNLREATGSLFFDRTSSAWSKYKNIYDDFKTLKVVAVSEWLYNRALKSPFFKPEQLTFINNGINSSIYYPRNTALLRKKYEAYKYVALHVNPTFQQPIKGGKFVLELANMNLNEDIVFLIVGYTGDKVSLPRNVVPIPLVRDENLLAEYYSLADVTILTSKKETFSLVCAESLSCGTPIIGFEAGAPEKISDSRMSEFVEYANINALNQALQKWKDFKRNITDKNLFSELTKKYSSDRMVDEYLALYKQEAL